MDIHEIYMQRAIELAKNALGNTYPNPIVGAVVVYNGKIIGEGYHTKAGQPHAEVNAINSVKNKKLLKNSTIYVTLEPCSHYGKTPPCAKLISDLKIPKVVVGTVDTTAKVSGKGIEMMKNAGCDVQIGVLEKECRELNKRFFTFHEKKRPYIILKWAQTMDGFIDVQRTAKTLLLPFWITDETSRTLVHKWRSQEQAIMVGSNTVHKDNPSLTVRNWSGINPVRISIDKYQKFRPDSKILDNQADSIVFISEEGYFPKKNVEFVKINFQDEILSQIFCKLHKRHIQSVIVEGGAVLLNSLIEKNLWDEAKIFYGNRRFGKGVEAPKIAGKTIKKIPINEHKLFVIKNNKI